MLSNMRVAGKFFTDTAAKLKQHFRGNAHLVGDGHADLSNILFLQRARFRGVIPSARLFVGTNPSNNDTVVIGGHTFTFKTTLGAAGASTQVKILGTAALTLAAFRDGINGTTNSNVVPGTTDFESVVAAVMAGNVGIEIQLADSQGGTALAKVSGSIALSDTLAAVGDMWDCANLNVSGKALEDQDVSFFKVAVTAGMITKGRFNVKLPFTPTVIDWQLYDSAGARIETDDTVAIDGASVKFTLGGGSTPAVQAGDYFVITALS